MFSMEDRRRAVDLYFTEGMTIRKVIAELGYPSEGALVKWVREDPRYTGACRRSYTLECKTNAARRALEGEPLARVARDAGCTPTSVYQWMRRYRSEGILGLMDRRNAPMPAEPMPAAGDDVEELRRQVEVLRLENAVMRETIDVLKADDPRLDPSMLTNRERTRVVDAIRGEFGLAACLKAVGLKRSTYYYERGAIAAGDRYAVLRARVAGLFEQGGRAWGYRTIHRMLRLDESDPIVVSEKVVRRIMREGAMRPVYLKRPKRWSSYAGEIGVRQNGAMISMSTEKAVAYALGTLQERGQLFVGPGDECYEGMLVGERSKPGDMVVNIARTKSLGNQRSSTADIAVQLTPPRTFTLEEALEYIMDDELVEITPKNIRMRKRILSETERRKWAVRNGQVSKLN